MKLIFGRDDRIGGNLGDELNAFIWPSLFKNAYSCNNDGIAFLGIGSILSPDPTYNWWMKESTKIIFGTGVRPFSQNLCLDDTMHIYFVRGPLSCNYLGLDKSKSITDSAYCLQFTPHFKDIVKVKRTKNVIGLIPHFQSLKYVNWDEICYKLGYVFISPICDGNNIIPILKTIASCDYIISEAMHGAILADIMRIPWARFVFSTYRNESSQVSEFKWMDWMFSLNLKYPGFLPIPMTNKINNGIAKISRGKIYLNSVFKHSITKIIIKKMVEWEPSYTLSKDYILNKVNSKLCEQIEKFRKDYESSLCIISGSHSHQ